MKRTAALAIIAVIIALGLQAAEKQTFVYDIADADTLRMDVYAATASSSEPSPAVIFAFGGGFSHGSRDDARYLPMFNFLADNGVKVVSVDYRTALAKIDPTDISDPYDFAVALRSAIQTAVLDFTHATTYVAAHADEWGIDPAAIFAAGSSAGAITVLQTQYQNCNQNEAVEILHPAFRYAGVISMAGAIFNDGLLRWRRMPAPMLLFHGDADSNVPYDRATAGTFGLWGSKRIVESINGAGVPYTFWTIAGANHSVAISPMDNHCGDILDWIRSVVQGRAAITVVNERPVDLKTPYNTTFTLDDYIESNMP